MKCGWKICFHEAIVDDGFCSDNHQKLWQCDRNDIGVRPDLVFPGEYVSSTSREWFGGREEASPQ